MKPLMLCLFALVLAACSDDQQAPPMQTTTLPAVQTQPVVQPIAAAVEPPKVDADAALAAKVKKALEAASAEISQGIDVTVGNGVVRLFGTVGSTAERSRAAEIAASTAGVASVENKLVVIKGS